MNIIRGLVLSLLMCFALFTASAHANEGIALSNLTEQPTSQYDVTEAEEYFSEKDPVEAIDLNTCEKTPAYIENIYEMSKANMTQRVLSTPSLPIGSNIQYSQANVGQDGWYPFAGNEAVGPADYSHDWGTQSNSSYGGWADARVNLSADIGGPRKEGCAWAAVGNRVQITGAQSQRNCKVTFKGNFNGRVSRLGDATALSRIQIRIIDVTNSNNVLGSYTINNDVTTGTINHYVNISLERGHTYDFEMRVYTEGHCDDPAPNLFSNAVSDYWSGGLGGWGINYSKITFEWL